MPEFRLVADVNPTGDQPEAIQQLAAGLRAGAREQVLLGVTGSGKTFTVANVIAEVNKPTLVLAPNKTLAAQLYGEFKELFPENAVEYFVSYYDYYQPEAYVPRTDTYIEKDSSINDDIDKMRHSATRSLIERNDVIIVASVSCIYGLGAREAYEGMLVHVQRGERIDRNQVLKKLVEIQYERNDMDFHRGVFRVRGDTVEVFPVWADDMAIRIEWFDDEIDRLTLIDPLRGATIEEIPKAGIFPASHYVTPEDNLKRAIEDIRVELRGVIQELRSQDKLIEAQRIEQRTMFDLEMLEETGRCRGIENYSRHLTGRNVGDPPPTLLDYFPRDWLMVIDESHIAVSQVGGMFHGDRSRKKTLVEYGFRLPSALDNRPLNYDEFEERLNQVIYVSATPGDFELKRTGGVVVEQIIRPTGLIDPEVIVRPVAQQVDDLLAEIRLRAESSERVLVTTLTKKMAEDLSEYYADIGVRVRYLHSEVDTLERIEIIRDLRLGKFDVLVGINLLREGLDIPEVSLVAILDADKEGFLRSERSLIQTIGRAARNANGQVILYADKITNSIRRALDETNRRREIQSEYNEEHGITPETVKKEIRNILDSIYEQDYVTVDVPEGEDEEPVALKDIPERITELRVEMKDAATDLEFERAAQLRDQIKELEKRLHAEYAEGV